MKRKITFCLAGLLLASTVMVFAKDWPQWRGPERNGISKETGLLKEWPKDGPKLLWQNQQIGSGYSTPAVVGESIYLLSNEGDKEFVAALSLKDGSKLWFTPIGKVGANKGPQYPGARSTPTIDGDVLYVLGSGGDLACLQTADGKVRWAKNLRTEFGGAPGSWAYAESPLIDGDTLVCTPGGKEATLVALNKKTGEVIWKSAISEGDEAGYASPIIVNDEGVKQYVQFMQKGLVGIDAKSGKFLWRYDKTAAGSPANIPSPVEEGGRIYTATGRGGAGLVELKTKDGAIAPEEVYFSKKLPRDIGGAVLLGNYLYGTAGPSLMCVDFKTGDVKWEERSVAPASICTADGLLFLHGENGDVGLVQATPDGYQEKGKFTPPNQPDRGNAKAWAYPVVAHGRLLVRDQGSLWCYDIKAK
jgi:outer membrane protein assembly factor BamB